MKTLRSLLAMAFTVLALSSCAQKITFPSLEGQNDVSKIYIGKTMMKMAGGSIPAGTIPSDLVSKMNSLEIISAENASGAAKIQNAFSEYMKENPDMEVLVQVDDSKDKVNIFATPGETADTYSKIIIYVMEGDGDTVLMVMNGRITSDDLVSLSGMGSKKQ